MKSTIFHLKRSDRNFKLNAISELELAAQAINLPPDSISEDDSDWFRPLVENPAQIFLVLAREHVKNRFNASEDEFSAQLSFRMAHVTLFEAEHNGVEDARTSTDLNEYC